MAEQYLAKLSYNACNDKFCQLILTIYVKFNLHFTGKKDWIQMPAAPKS